MDGRPPEIELAPGEIGSFRSLSRLRKWFLFLSAVSLTVCAAGGVLHYSKRAWGNVGQPGGWILSMVFLLLAFLPPVGEVVRRLRKSLNWKTLFFAFWILVFTVSHLWNFRIAPWNQDALFDESGWDLFFLKHYVIGHPYQAAWFQSPLSRETLFHYYVWAFLSLFGYNILSYEAALFVIWCVIFIVTLLLVDLLFDSWVVTSATALVFNFFPFSFVYTFVGYRYPMGTALCVISLYFLHLGFKKGSSFSLVLGGITAGLCWASSINGKQYLLVLFLFGVFYAVFAWRRAKAHFSWNVPIIVYGCLAAATPLLCYIASDFEHYALYERSLIGYSLYQGLDLRVRQLWECFFKLPGPRFFLHDTLPIPLPYYGFVLPGLVLAVLKKRYEIVLLAIIPILGAFIAEAWDNRLLLAIPFWIILMAFTFAGLWRMKLASIFKVPLLGMAAAFLIFAGLTPSLRYIKNMTNRVYPTRYFANEDVAVSRFLRHLVAGLSPVNPPRLERDEFNRISGIPDPPYDTLICQLDAYSILHLFLHDYDDAKIMSFCGDVPFNPQTEQQIWSTNKKAIANHVENGKDLKLVWEKHQKTERIIKMFEPLRDIGREELLVCAIPRGGTRTFYTLTFQGRHIGELKERVKLIPDSIQ